MYAAFFSGSFTVTLSSLSGFSDTVFTGVQLRVWPLHRAGLVLRGGDETDSAMVVLVAVPLNEASYPLPCSINMGEAIRGITGTILARTEQRLRVGVIVADPWATERGGDA